MIVIIIVTVFLFLFVFFIFIPCLFLLFAGLSCFISSVNPVSCRWGTFFSHFFFPPHRLSSRSSFAETYFHNSFWDSVIEYPYYMLLGKIHFWFAPIMIHVLPFPSSLISSPQYLVGSVSFEAPHNSGFFRLLFQVEMFPSTSISQIPTT